MAGIKDIAKQAGYSISTVSYALNGSDKVTEETRQKILTIANELGYVPNGAARMLRSRGTKIIGVYVADYSGSFWGQLLEGMRKHLNQCGYDLVVCLGKQSRRLLLEKMLDGALILDHSFSDEAILNSAKLGHKIVTLDRQLFQDNMNHVLLDNMEGARLAIKNLLHHSITRLYIITGPMDSFDSRKRLEGTKQILKEYAEVHWEQIEGDFTKDSGSVAAERIISSLGKSPIGIFCFNDEMAIGVYNYIKQTDYKIGEEVYIVGFDNIELSAYVEPRLTTVNYSTFEWGQKSAELLLKLLADEPVDNQIIEVELIEGKSS